MCQKLQDSWNVNPNNTNVVGQNQREDEQKAQAQRMAQAHRRISETFNCGRPGCEMDIATLPRPQLRRSVAQRFKRTTGFFVCTRCG